MELGIVKRVVKCSLRVIFGKIWKHKGLSEAFSADENAGYKQVFSSSKFVFTTDSDVTRSAVGTCEILGERETGKLVS